MLTVTSRNDGRKGLGFRAAGMEENELEEGEAWSDHEDNALINPDALSYIDEKIQKVLGHFQKDFEGGVSAENLGTTYGGYGSFLLAYQRSPNTSNQVTSSPNAPSRNGVRSPGNHVFEGTRQNTSILTYNAPVTRNVTVNVAPPFNRQKVQAMDTNASSVGESLSLYGSVNALPGNDQKTLKFRIKVGTESISSIYSGLGLDISPSPAPEGSPDCSEGLSAEARNSPYESPMAIIQIMTSFPVPGECLLSPLSDAFLNLTEKEILSFNNLKINSADTCNLGLLPCIPDSSQSAGGMKTMVKKKIGHVEENGKVMNLKNLASKSDANSKMKRESDAENISANEMIPNPLNISSHSSSTGINEKDDDMFNESRKGNKVPDIPLEQCKVHTKDRVHPAVEKPKHKSKLKEITKSSGNKSPGRHSILSDGRPGFRESVPDKVLEEKGVFNFKCVPDFPNDVILEAERTFAAGKDNFEDHKLRKNGKTKNSEYSKKRSSHGVPLCDKGGEIMLPGKDQATKEDEKGRIQNSASSSFDPIKKKNKGNLSVALERKETCSRTAESSNGVFNELKMNDLQNNSLCKASNDNLIDAKNKLVDHRRTVAYDKDKLKDLVDGNGKDFAKPSEKLRDRSVGKKVDITPTFEEKVGLPPASAPNIPHSDALGGPQAPVVIKETWVCCDSCQKWRLLPYEMDPDYYKNDLFLCTMQNWLPPGLSNCSVSEDETKKALDALYIIPMPESDTNMNGLHYDTALKSANNAHIDPSFGDSVFGMSVPVKKKHGSKEPYSMCGNPALTQCTNSMKKNSQAAKSRSLSNMNHRSGEANSSSKLGMDLSSKFVDYSLHKQQNKQKDKHTPGVLSDADHVVENGAKHSKSKTKRAPHQDETRTSKKSKTAGSGHRSNTYHSDQEVNNKNSYNYHHKDGNDDLQNDASGDKIKRQVQVLSNKEGLGHLSASDVVKSDKADFATKKRKLREWQESQGHKEIVDGNGVEVIEAFSENNMKKEKKKIPYSEAKDSSSSKADGKVDSARGSKVLFSVTKQHLPNTMEDDRFIDNKEMQLEQFHRSTTTRQVSDGMESCRKDFLYGQPAAAATSSTSKISESRRSRAQEVKGSPVESVSSSPLRLSNMETLHSSRVNAGARYDSVDAGLSITKTAKKFSDEGAIGGSGIMNETKSVLQGAEELNGVQQLTVSSSGGGTYNYVDKKTKDFNDKAKHGIHLKLFGEEHEDFSPAEFQEVYDVCNGRDRPHDGQICPQNMDEAVEHHAMNGVIRGKSGRSSSHVKDGHSPSSNSVKGKIQVRCLEQGELNSSNLKRVKENYVENNSHDDRDLHKDSRSGNFNQEKRGDDYIRQKEAVAKVPIGGPRDTQLESDVKLNNREHESCLQEKHSRDAKLSFTTSNFDEKSIKQETLVQMSEDDRNQVIPYELASGRGKLDILSSSRDKTETLSRHPKMVHSPHVGKSDIFVSGASNVDGSKVTKLTKTMEMNGESRDNIRQATSNGHDLRNLEKKDSHHISTALKEARGLKHKATRLMEDGLILEGLGLYYESGLKFLQIAFQMENDSAKHGELSQSVKIYSDTGKLCDYCAREYEKNKQMAASALAYKGMEAAFMKVLYLKHSSASKDKHDLRTALQLLLPGESPSSSASDVDNLNNQGTSDKAAQTKGVGSPQIAGSNILSSHNRPIFVRLLNYTNETFSAFEATRKMHVAFDAAKASLGKDSTEHFSMVKTAIDSSFHDIERLVQLLRLSMESINE